MINVTPTPTPTYSYSTKEEGFQRTNGDTQFTDWCYSIKRRKTDGDDGTKRGHYSINQLWYSNYSTDRDINDKYVSVSTGVLSYSIQIQFFSQNQSLFSPIKNQIIIKKSDRRIKKRQDDDDDNSDGSSSSSNNSNNNSKATHMTTTAAVATTTAK